MLFRKRQADNQNQLIFLIGAFGSFLLLILVAVLVVNLTRPELIDKLIVTIQMVTRDTPQTVMTFLNEQAQAMSIPLAEGSHAYWYLARAGGVVSYLLLWLATCWGIMMSSKIFKGYMNFASAYALHEFLPILGVVFATVHVLVLLGDSYVNFNIWQLLVPFTSSYKPFWTGLGSLAFYVFLALVISSYLRKKIGQKNWRIFHYVSYMAFLFALLHGFMAGTDNSIVVMRALYLVTGGITLFLVYYRLLAHVPKRQNHLSKTGAQTMDP